MTTTPESERDWFQAPCGPFGGTTSMFTQPSRRKCSQSQGTGWEAEVRWPLEVTQPRRSPARGCGILIMSPTVPVPPFPYLERGIKRDPALYGYWGCLDGKSQSAAGA